MTHLATGGAGSATPPSFLGTQHPAPASGRTFCRHLDRDRLRSGIARRRQELGELETAMVAACEAAAARPAPRAIRVDDRETWDRSMWQRYLDAATRLEPEYGPPMRRLVREIEQLQRLVEMPLAV